MTIEELMRQIIDAIDSGKVTKDSKILISDDEEGNGFHHISYVQGYDRKEIESDDDVSYQLEDKENNVLLIG